MRKNSRLRSHEGWDLKKNDVEVKESQNLDLKTRAGKIFKVLEANDFVDIGSLGVR